MATQQTLYEQAWNEVENWKNLKYTKNIVNGRVTPSFNLDSSKFSVDDKFVSHYATILYPIFDTKYHPLKTYVINFEEKSLDIAYEMAKLPNINITSELMKFVLETGVCYRIDRFIALYTMKNIKIPLVEIIDLVTQEKIKSSYLFICLDKYEYKNFVICEKAHDYMFKYGMKNNMEYVIKQPGFVPKDDYFHHCIVKLGVDDVYDKIYDMLCAISPVQNISHLHMACIHTYPNFIKKLLDQKIKPDEQCIVNVCENDTKLDEKIEMIEMLINYGYCITMKDLLMCIENGIAIDEKYVPKDFFKDTNFVNKLTVVCNKSLIFAYGINPNTDGIIGHIKQRSSAKTIKRFIETNKLTPTIECLQEACKNPYNCTIIRLLIDKYGLVPDTICLINSVLSKAETCAQIKYIVDHTPATVLGIQN